MTTDFDPPAGLSGPRHDEANAVVIQPDGKIVAAGTSSSQGTLAIFPLGPGAGSFVLARYNADGTLDGTFGAGGTVTTFFSHASSAADIALHGDGRLVVVGSSTLDLALARYQPNGQLDPGFGQGGTVVTDLSPGFADIESGNAVALQPDGRIVVTGFVSTSQGPSLVLARYLVAPTPDEILVGGLYEDLLQRAADPSGLAFWTALLGQGMAPAEVAQRLAQSPEYLATQIVGFYHRFLDRAAEPGAVAFWLDFLARGNTLDEVQAPILGSSEYQVRLATNQERLLEAIYADVFNRSLDPTGEEEWGRRLSQGTTSAEVALAIVQSEEARTRTVQRLYRQLLGRDPDDTGLRHFVALLQ